MLVPKPFSKRPKGPAKLYLILGMVVLVVALTSGLALAHGGIVLDGVLADWCFPALLTGVPDSRTPLTPPGCGFGNEVLWEDAPGDAFTLLMAPPVDIQTFTTTADPTNVYFAIIYAPMIGPAKHFQIAIDVAPGGTQIWYNPAVPPAPIGPVGLSNGIFADYLIAVDTAAANPTLWEATTTPGIWTNIPLPPTVAPGPGIIEIAVPWTSFTCTGCPPLIPGTATLMTVLAVYDDSGGGCSGLIGAPCNIDVENDVFSELAPGTFTTTTLPCIPGPGSTLCELADGSADAFIAVTYQNPTAVEIAEMTTRAQENHLAPILGALLLGSSLAWLVLRRKTQSKQV